jgi:O-antigen ligase
MPSYFSVLILLVLAWGAFAFGAVYAWAYTPLFWAAAAVGLVGWIAPGSTEKPRVPWGLVAAVALIAIVAGLQLIPLTPGQLSTISPAADPFLARYDLGYASVRSAVNAVPARGYRHPLSISPSGTLLGLAALTALGLLLVGTVRGLGRDALRTLAAGVVILGAALALAGIVQSGLYLRDPQKSGLVYGFWKPIFGTDPFGPFINRNHFAGWMLLALPVAIGYFSGLVDRGMRGVKPVVRERVLWFSSPDASRVILVGLAILVMGLSLVLTFSRSGISGFLLAVAISAWVVLRRHTHRSRRAVTLAYLVLLVVLTVSWVGFDALVQRFADAEDTQLGGRLPIWSDTVKVVRDFPWTGTGLNTYGTSMLLYQEHNLETHNAEAHNDYLQLAAEGGVLLGIPAAWLLFVLIREIRRRFREPTDDTMGYWLRVGATTGLVAIALQETVEFSLQMPGIAALFVVVAAIAIRPASA